MNRVLTCYYRFKPGGYCTRLVRTMQALLDNGCEVHYVALAPFPVSGSNCHFHRFPWPVQHSNSLFFWIVFHFLAPFLLLYIGIRYHISHAFCFGANYALLLQPLRIVRRIPLTLFMRGDPIAHHKLEGRPRWLIFLEFIVEGAALPGTRVFGVSRALVRRLVSRHRILRPTYTGLLPNDVSRKPRSSRPIHSPLRLASVGTFDRQKNQGVLIRALQGHDPDKVELHVFGSGRHEWQLRLLAQETATESLIRFHGWVPSDEIWQNVDVLLFPSLFEGSPNAVLEAIGRGVPVLASDIPELRELLPATSLLPAEDPSEWNRRISGLLEDVEALSELTKRQATFAQRLCFDWDDRIVGLVLAREP